MEVLKINQDQILSDVNVIEIPGLTKLIDDDGDGRAKSEEIEVPPGMTILTDKGIIDLSKPVTVDHLEDGSSVIDTINASVQNDFEESSPGTAKSEAGKATCAPSSLCLKSTTNDLIRCSPDTTAPPKPQFQDAQSSSNEQPEQLKKEHDQINSQLPQGLKT